MVAEDIEKVIGAFIRDRKAMLWVCQRHDLAAGAEPHDYDVPAGAALLRYRDAPSETDRAIAGLFWDCVWLEGARSPLLDAIRDRVRQSGDPTARQVVVLAGANDADARVPSDEFLPVVVFPGLIEATSAADSRYGELRSRVRKRIAWDLASRLRAYSKRLLVIAGARAPKDLEFVYEVLEDLQISDLTVLLLWPVDAQLPEPPSSAGLSFLVWQASEEDFIGALARLGAPSASDVPSSAVRVGSQRIVLAAKELRRIGERFSVITERSLIRPNTFTAADLEDFLRGAPDAWAAFAAGLPSPRSYRTEEGRTLTQEVLEASAAVYRQQDGIITFTIQLPAEGGAGATTLLRGAAFAAASEGYPTLVLRPEQVDVDIEDLLAFTTTVSEACLAAGFDHAPPTVLVLDAEHAEQPGVANVAQSLAVHGRPAVVLQCVRYDETLSPAERRIKRVARLRPLLAVTEPAEVEQCGETFRAIVDRWNLPIGLPSIDHWQSYSRQSAYYTPVGTAESASLFWVALRFFLTEGTEFTSRDNIEDALGAWLQKRTRKLTDPGTEAFVSFIAALSSFRLISPLTTVLRPITGGVFSSGTLEALRDLADLIAWGEPSADFGDQTLRFHHPALAYEFLRRQGIRSAAERANEIIPVLRALSAGHAADVWLAESVAIFVLAPKREERGSAEWDWRLRLFEEIPPLICNQSKTILHHWARCLYQSADRMVYPPLPLDQRTYRIEQAIARLRAATSLPRRPGRDEHPSHLYNTLGTAYTRLANLLSEKEEHEAASAVWKAACGAFEQSISSSPGLNVEALLAFSWRLLEHAGQPSEIAKAGTEWKTSEVAHALSLLDEAEELLRDSASSTPEWEEQVANNKARALGWLSSEASIKYIKNLESQPDPELGFYCEARLVLWNEGRGGEVDGALDVLDRAEAAGVPLRPRSLALRLMLLRIHPTKRFDFRLQKKLYDQLDEQPAYAMRPIDRFRHAVLCYQVGSYQLGAEKFRKLREELRRAEGAPPRMRDVWRGLDHPESPRKTNVRVSRITTEWRADGYVDDLAQTVPLRPRHFTPPPKENDVVSCVIRFEMNGPLAVPPRFEEETRTMRPGRR